MHLVTRCTGNFFASFWVGSGGQRWPLQSHALFARSMYVFLVQSIAHPDLVWLEAIAIRLDAIAIRLETIAIRLEAIAIGLEAIPIRLEAIAIGLEAMASRLDAIAIRLEAILLG